MKIAGFTQLLRIMIELFNALHIIWTLFDDGLELIASIHWQPVRLRPYIHFGV